jgi:uncharacterized protein YbjT (DUF2867 family)
MDRQKRILLTGGTGYVGGRLLKFLEDDGYHVCCIARRPQVLQGRVGPNTEVVFSDCSKPSLKEVKLLSRPRELVFSSPPTG